MLNIIQNGGIIYIQQSGNDIQYQSNSKTGVWTTFSSWPVTFKNTNPVSGNVLTVSITTPITILNTPTGPGTNGYFICGSSYITYDGTEKTVTISNVFIYPGLIQNGTVLLNGYANIIINNINMTQIASEINYNSGWVCHSYFGKGVTYCYVNNCNTDNTCDGNLSSNIGLICGQLSNGVICNNCSSAGNIAGGGIFGSDVTNCEANNCYSTGTIGNSNTTLAAGGIYSINCNNTNKANKCYSTGNICYSSFSGSGGICGQECGVNVTNCYSNGIIGFNIVWPINCGGIFGRDSNGNATNCYSSGFIRNNNADSGIGGTGTKTNCYVANGSWSDSSANLPLALTGTPTSVSNPGLIWTSKAPNTPYILSTITPPPPPIEPITQNGGVIYIQQSGNNIQYQRNSITGIWTTISDWPVTFKNTNPVSGNVLIISLFTNLTILDTTIGISAIYFNTGSSYITYDGNDKIVTIANVNNYPGLIQNGTDLTNGYSNVTVQNINNAITGSSRLVVRGGWICQWYFGKSATNILINNCSNSAAINGIDFAYGGICGAFAARYGGNISITNCSNSGAISGSQASGICGQQAGDTNGTVSISNCFNTGAISGKASGGICGTRTGYKNGTVLITNCYNSGVINGDLSGGITADYFGYDSDNICSIINCYNTGDINGSNAGGICGSNVGYNNNGTTTPQILIQNCYSLGNISTTCGGICGGSENDIYTNPPIVNIINCYTSYNSIVQAGSEYVSLTLQTDVRKSIISSLTNVYSSLTNAWSDTDANSALPGALSIYKNSKLYKYYSNFGEIWYSNQNNSPFSFTSDLDIVPRRQQRN